MKPAKPRAAPRLHSPDPLRPGAEVELSARALAHIAALRLRAGDLVTLFDGAGGEHAAQLVQSGRALRAAMREFLDVERESPLAVTLAQCISSGERMDITLQKATELGIAAIQPLQSERSIVRLSEERMARRHAHWQNVVIAACEQCGRNRVPLVSLAQDFRHWLAGLAGSGVKLLLDPDATHSLKQTEISSPMVLLVGPEGGLSPEERELAGAAGFNAARLGPRVLRTETAPLAALAALQAMYGDL